MFEEPIKEIDFRSERYFGELMTFNSYITIVFGLMAFFFVPIIGVVLIVQSTIIFATHRRIYINPGKHEYREYVWSLGLKFGATEKYETIEYVYIKTNRIIEHYEHETYTDTLRRTVYDAYLKFSEGNKIRIVRKKGRKGLLKQLKPIVLFLNARVFDYSEGEATLLNL